MKVTQIFDHSGQYTKDMTNGIEAYRNKKGFFLKRIEEAILFLKETSVI